ncbi:uroporphyrinogen-III synthase [Rubritepida flocculans]|uniref:uroporphyrinogen-III synthase n=1 Tax=Rubritepida flocculans TaxID=182403 RepID=UPI00048255F3|nr:uroporphyrinogen-III synthase [Rubritepida flocculans]
MPPRGPSRGAVLVTRPEPGAQETAARLAAMGWGAVLAPALILAPRPFAPPPRAQALLLPSRAAARALPPLPLPVLAVGPGTAEAARAQGFAQVEAAGGDGASLAAHCAARLDPAAGPLLLAVGQGYSLELAARLRAAGFRVIRRVVYAAREAEALPPAARAALQGSETSHALFFSPRSAACSVRLIREAGLGGQARGMTALAISPRVAAVLAELPWKAIRVAPRPDQDHLLELLDTP